MRFNIEGLGRGVVTAMLLTLSIDWNNSFVDWFIWCAVGLILIHWTISGDKKTEVKEE